MPNVIDDCNLILENGYNIYIGKVYLFNVNRFHRIIRLGDLSLIRVFKGRRIVGYFSTSDLKIRKYTHEKLKIVGNINAIEFQINDVSFSKTSNQMTRTSNCIYVKFSANSVKQIFK